MSRYFHIGDFFSVLAAKAPGGVVLEVNASCLVDYDWVALSEEYADAVAALNQKEDLTDADIDFLKQYAKRIIDFIDAPMKFTDREMALLKRERRSALLIDMPSPTGSITEIVLPNGMRYQQKNKHAVSALIDNEVKKVYLYEPLQIADLSVVAEQLVAGFPGYEVEMLALANPQQQIGETHCTLLAAINAGHFLAGGTELLSREEIMASYDDYVMIVDQADCMRQLSLLKTCIDTNLSHFARSADEGVGVANGLFAGAALPGIANKAQARWMKKLITMLCVPLEHTTDAFAQRDELCDTLSSLVGLIKKAELPPEHDLSKAVNAAVAEAVLLKFELGDVVDKAAVEPVVVDLT